MKKILFTSAVILLLFQTTAFCQNANTVLQNAVSKLKGEIIDHMTEKAYLHFDRPYPYYVAGEAVYFKAYVTMGERNELSNISGLLHVDLIGKNDVLMQSISLQLTNGTGWGDFALPDTLQKGSYRIRAYTEWMRNAKKPYFFDQFISVSSVNSVDRVASTSNADRPPSLQFFPEGGNMVVDVRSKVAFKAIGPDGMGVNVNGIIVDNANKEVAKISSNHQLGMGVFNFLPEAGMTYSAHVTYADGSKGTVNLPAVETQGITLSVNTDDPTKVSIEIKANRAYYKANLNKELNLLVYWGGAVRTYSPKLDNEVLGLDLATKDFKTGILQVTLLSETGEPLNERMVFIQNPDLLNLALSTNKASYAKRENVQLNLNAKNKDGNAVNGYFSVSVIDESKILVDENAENTILSYLLLTSDVKGYVEKPNYYFANVTKETRTNLDALMLTQGYRRFVWKELMNDNSNTAATYKPEQNIDISGVLKTKAGVPIANAKLSLIADAGGPVLSAVTDNDGKFKFADIVYESGTHFVLKTSSSSGKNAAILTLDKPATGPILTPGNAIETKYNANADILASFQNQRQGIMTASNESIVLKNDRVIGPKRNDNYRSSSLSGPGHADQVIHGDDIKNATSLSNGLNGLVRGVDFINGSAYPRNNSVLSSGGTASNAMVLVIDGNIVNGSLDNISPVTVETVEILKGANASIYGSIASAGVIVVTSRQGGAASVVESKEMSPGVFSIMPKGFYKAREFYLPKYDANQTSKLPDTRTTIFWKPDVTTNADGNAVFNYFNSDGTGSYRVVVEGMDSKGNLGRQVFHYKVE